MAALLKEQFQLESKLTAGRNGIFEVRFDDRVLAKKTFDGFPSEETIAAAVASALGR